MVNGPGTDIVCSEPDCDVVFRLKDGHYRRAFKKPVRTSGTVSHNPALITLVMDDSGDSRQYVLAYVSDGVEHEIDVTEVTEMVIGDETDSVSLCLMINNVVRKWE